MPRSVEDATWFLHQLRPQDGHAAAEATICGALARGQRLKSYTLERASCRREQGLGFYGEVKDEVQGALRGGVKKVK